jgi:putative zinc finger protein
MGLVTRFSAEHADGGEPDFNRLAAVAEGRLHARERSRVLEHLASCAECRSIVAELARGRGRRRTVRNVATLPLAASLAIATVSGGIYWLVRDHAPHGAAPLSQPPSAAPAVVAPSSQSSPARPVGPGVVSPAEPAQTGGAAPRSPQDRTRAAGTRSVAGKTFHLVAGEWIDAGYRLNDFLPEVDIRSRADLDAHAELGRFAGLGRRFTVVVNGTVYHIALPPIRR